MMDYRCDKTKPETCSMSRKLAKFQKLHVLVEIQMWTNARITREVVNINVWTPRDRFVVSVQKGWNTTRTDWRAGVSYLHRNIHPPRNERIALSLSPPVSFSLDISLFEKATSVTTMVKSLCCSIDRPSLKFRSSVSHLLRNIRNIIRNIILLSLKYSVRL